MEFPRINDHLLRAVSLVAPPLRDRCVIALSQAALRRYGRMAEFDPSADGTQAGRHGAPS
jgi:hypothetical protein